jgi:hypothetical protein
VRGNLSEENETASFDSQRQNPKAEFGFTDLIEERPQLEYDSFQTGKLVLLTLTLIF